MRDEKSNYRRRIKQQELVRRSLFSVSIVPLALTIVIAIVLLYRSLPLLESNSIWGLLSGTDWKPIQGYFGYLPFISGTFWVTAVAFLLAIIPCTFTAIYLSEYAGQATRSLIKPMLDVLAAIPTVVYGAWGIIVVVPFVGNVLRPALGQILGFIPLFASNQPTGYSILAGGIVLAIAITPFIIAVTYEVLMTAPQDWRKASLAMGATRWQTICRVILPRRLTGIIAALVLGISRAFGETMAVLMVVGNVVQIPNSIFDAAYPLPALIANNYGEMMSIPLYDAALLGAAFILLIIVLIFNIAATLLLQRLLGGDVI